MKIFLVETLNRKEQTFVVVATELVGSFAISNVHEDRDWRAWTHQEPTQSMSSMSKAPL